MKTPYSFDLANQELLSEESLQMLPEWCSHSMSFAKEQHQYRLRAMDLVLQRHNYQPFHIDLMQVNVVAENAPPLCLLLNERQLILYFMLQGEFLITTADEKPIVVTRSNTLLMGYADTGKYHFVADIGQHVAMVVVIEPEWLESVGRGLKAIEDIVYRFQHDEKPYETLHHLKMEQKVQRWLQKIYGFSQSNIGAIDGNLRKYISYILEYYASAMEGKNDDLAYRVKTYLDEHYTDSDLSLRSLEERFSITKRMLLNHFKRQYHTTPYHYSTKLRMEQARWLIDEKKLPIDQVYMKVGYQNENAFRIAYRKYFKG